VLLVASATFNSPGRGSPSPSRSRGGARPTARRAEAAAQPGGCRPKLPGHMRVEEATAVSPELVSALGRLVGQLSTTASIPTAEEIQEIVDSAATRLLLARDHDHNIIGTLTLRLFRVPTGMRAWIEDVVVDEAARGQGAGQALTEEALRLARAAGARTVDLTSRPEREAANRLYESLGFARRSTSVYRYELS